MLGGKCLAFGLQCGFPCTRFRGKIFSSGVLLLLIFTFYLFATSPIPAHSLDKLHDTDIRGSNLASPISGVRNSTRILLVSAMFPLAKSKHSPEDYSLWLARFLQPITTDVYFFTVPALADTVRNARGADLQISIDTTYASPFEVPPLKGMEAAYNTMHDLDREKFRHGPELYAVWNVKPFLLDSAVKVLNQKGQVYDYAFWNDAGSFRSEHEYKSRPDPGRVDQIWEIGSTLTGLRKDELLFFPLTGLPDYDKRKWEEGMGPVDDEVSEGSFFGGSPSTISWWSTAFYRYHDYYLSKGLFVGKDQTLINALFLLFPERIITVWYHDPLALAHSGMLPLLGKGYLGACGAEWFYYQFWLAGREERDKMRDLWLNHSSWSSLSWQWWKERQTCRLTSVLSLNDVFTRWFGKNWKPPTNKSNKKV